MPDKDKQKYKVLVGINYPGLRGEKRANEGAVVDDIPEADIAGLLRAHVIEKYKPPKDKADTEKDGEE